MTRTVHFQTQPWELKMQFPCLGQAAQLVGASFHAPNVTGWAAYGRQLMDVSLSHQYFSLSLSFPPSSLPKINKNISSSKN